MVENIVAKITAACFNIPEQERVKPKRSFVVDAPLDQLVGSQNFFTKLSKWLAPPPAPTKQSDAVVKDDRI